LNALPAGITVGWFDRQGDKPAESRVAVQMMRIRHVRVCVPDRLMAVPVTVCTGRHFVVGMAMVAVVVPVRMIVLERIVLVFVAVRLCKVEQNAEQH